MFLVRVDTRNFCADSSIYPVHVNGHRMAEDVFQILVVDDDPDVREMLQLLVTNVG